MLCEDLNIGEHYKILANAFGVPDDLQEYACYDTYEAEATAKAAAEAKRIAEIKYAKDMRRESIDRTIQTVVELIATIFDITAEDVIESVADTDLKTDTVHRFFKQNGLEALVFSYNQKMAGFDQINVLNESEFFQTDQCVIMYRGDNSSEVTLKNMVNLINVSDIKPNEELSMPFILARIFREVWLPAFVQYGQSEQTDTVMVVKACELFLENCDSITKNAILLEIDSDFYEKHLSTKEKIQATAENRELFEIIERISKDWMRIIEKILIKGKVIRRNSSGTGPIDELEHWLQTHSMYSIAQELITTETFESHMKCLQISGSKLAHKWKMIADKLQVANSEASENVQFLNSLERFQFPLYGKITNIKAHVNPLFEALRTVYKTSAFYNTPNSMASFLSKCTNHLTLCCRRYIANGDSSNLFLQKPDKLLEKIEIYLDLLRSYRKTFEETMVQMKASGEPEWDFAEKYVFGQANLLVARLSKLQEIIETDKKYAVLEDILMENIQDYSDPINKAHDEITKKPYDHLDFRNEQFEADFDKWKTTMKRIESEMHTFVKDHINEFPTTPWTALNHLRRFESLNFECLSIEDRYVDIIMAFINNINTLKEAFNLKKEHPNVPNLMCKYSGRISWARSIENKLYEIVALIKEKDIFNQEKQVIVQRTIKFYNALSKDLTLYEFQQYKAWFDNVHYIFDLLSQPVLRRNKETNRFEANFDIAILNTIEEGKKIQKLHLDMPQLGEALVKYEEELKQKLRNLRLLIKRNDDLRLSINILFVNICRPQLQKIDIALKPGLSQIQWLSKDFDAYIRNADSVLDAVECLVKRASDRKTYHIEDIIISMNELNLLKRFDEPIDMQLLLDKNEEHKKEIASRLETGSIVAQKATVELIRLFIEHTDIASDDKNDFISFEKLFQQVFLYSEGDHIEPLFKDYGELNYGVEQLHSDCMDLFNYFVHLILSGMLNATKKAYDQIRERFFRREVPAVLVVAKLNINSGCFIEPPLDSLSQSFSTLVHNITDIFDGMDSWGEMAAIAGSSKYDFASIDLKQGFLKNLLENKEIQRAITKFDSGLSLLAPEIDHLLKDLYTKNCFLWTDNIEAELKELVDSDPYPSPIEDMFVKYQKILNKLEQAKKLSQVDCIAIDLTEVYGEFIEHAKKWKRRLAEMLADIYKDKYDELNDFIEDTEIVLRRKLKDDDDFTSAVECLLNVYRNSERLETNLYKTTNTYAILEKFGESIGKVNKADIDQLPARYNRTFTNTKMVEVYIRNNFDEIMSKIE